MHWSQAAVPPRRCDLVPGGMREEGRNTTTGSAYAPGFHGAVLNQQMASGKQTTNGQSNLVLLAKQNGADGLAQPQQSSIGQRHGSEINSSLARPHHRLSLPDKTRFFP